jgi:hypothetical protein
VTRVTQVEELQEEEGAGAPVGSSSEVSQENQLLSPKPRESLGLNTSAQDVSFNLS